MYFVKYLRVVAIYPPVVAFILLWLNLSSCGCIYPPVVEFILLWLLFILLWLNLSSCG